MQSPIYQIILDHRQVYSWLLVACCFYCVVLFLWKWNFPESYKLGELTIVIGWTLIVMSFMSALLPPLEWMMVALGLLIGALPIIVYSKVSWGIYLEELVKGIRDYLNGDK